MISIQPTHPTTKTSSGRELIKGNHILNYTENKSTNSGHTATTSTCPSYSTNRKGYDTLM